MYREVHGHKVPRSNILNAAVLGFRVEAGFRPGFTLVLAGTRTFCGFLNHLGSEREKRAADAFDSIKRGRRQ